MKNKKLGFIVIIFAIVFIFSYVQQKIFCQEVKLSSWVKDLLAKEEKEQVANPPASLTKCVYKDKIVYYLPPRCCDIGSILYDENGNFICSPDGGFAGSGEGKCPDFFEKRTNCEIIWNDSRSYPPVTEVRAYKTNQ